MSSNQSAGSSISLLVTCLSALMFCW